MIYFRLKHAFLNAFPDIVYIDLWDSPTSKDEKMGSSLMVSYCPLAGPMKNIELKALGIKR